MPIKSVLLTDRKRKARKLYDSRERFTFLHASHLLCFQTRTKDHQEFLSMLCLVTPDIARFGCWFTSWNPLIAEAAWRKPKKEKNVLCYSAAALVRGRRWGKAHYKCKSCYEMWYWKGFRYSGGEYDIKNQNCVEDTVAASPWLGTCALQHFTSF